MRFTHNKDVEAMARAFCLLALMFLHSAAGAETVWRALGEKTEVTGSGDVLGSSGSSLSLVSTEIGKAGFSGAITSLDATAYRGREVVLSGVLQVEKGAGSGAMWVRADQLRNSVNFKNTGSSPVRLQDGAQAREVRLYVPLTATSLKFGVTLTDVGSLRAVSLKLHEEAARSSEVSAYDVLDAAITIIGAKALNRAKVDWRAERAQVLTPALKDLPAMEAYSRIKIMLAKLGDHHSFLQTPETAAQYRASAVPSQPLTASASGNIGYLRVPGLMGSDRDAAAQFASSVCRSLEEMADRSSYGVILDLRENRGGNMWPMMSGLHALLGSGEVGAFRDADGNTTPIKARPVAGCKNDMTRKPVAVLIGKRTVSSGEAVAVAFKARPVTRFFGEPTAGLSTSNRGFPLPDGSMLRLTTGADVDRSGRVYPGVLTPDVQVDDGQDAIKIAGAWLRSIAQ